MFMSKKTVGFCEGEIIDFRVKSKTQIVTIWCLQNLAIKSQSPPEMAAHVPILKSEEKISFQLFSAILYSIWNASNFLQSKLSKSAQGNQGLYFQVESLF